LALFSDNLSQISDNRKPENSAVVKDNLRYRNAIFQDLSGTRIKVSDTLAGDKFPKQYGYLGWFSLLAMF
jgi:hypothetical protein